jgi:hypothetical protein
VTNPGRFTGVFAYAALIAAALAVVEDSWLGILILCAAVAVGYAWLDSIP